VGEDAATGAGQREMLTVIMVKLTIPVDEYGHAPVPPGAVPKACNQGECSRIFRACANLLVM
jgi:hypothetical protein